MSKNYIIENELVDTYGGDYTYRSVWYEYENGEYIFYEEHSGAKPSSAKMITDSNEVKELMGLIDEL